LNFAGFIETENEVSFVAQKLADNLSFTSEGRYSIRVIMISQKKPNKNQIELTHISFDDIIDFLVNIRGCCWINNNIGVASIHYQWDKLINKIFQIANDSIEPGIKKRKIKSLLSQ